MAALGSQAAAVALQLVVPRVLLAKWGDGGYAVFIAVSGVAAYLSLADAGVQMFLTQRLAVLRGAGLQAEASRLARGALRALLALAVAGLFVVGAILCAIGHAAMSGVISAGSVSWKAFFVAIVVQLASAAFSLVTGGWSAAVEQSNEKYARSPIAVLCRTLASTSVLVACAYAGVTSSIALIASACATFPIDLARFLWTRTLVPRGHEATGIGDVLRGARGSLLLMVAAATQGGLWPAVAAAVAPLAVGVAIPARTVANGARLLSAVAQNVLWAPLAGRFASIGDPTRMYEFWKRHAPILGVVQMTGVVGLVVVAPAAVHLWLPSKAAGIDGLLPIFCAEQALLIATIPSIVLLQAVGHFGRLGAMQAAQSLVGVVITLLLMPRFGALGFAVASVSSTALCMVPGALLAEYAHWSSMGRTPTGLLGARLALAMAALACAPTMALSRWLAGGLAISVFAAGSVHALWALRLGRADKTPSTSSGVWR